ncbi:MAG: hypothetical protein U0269_02865 [Polyangiales bacterium]
MSADIARWSAALDSLLVAGPSTLSAIERRALFSDALRAPLPPRVRSAFERLVAVGEREALLELCAWARAAAQSRASCATADGELVAIEFVERPAIALADQPIERWVAALSSAASDEAAGLIATAQGPVARATVAELVARVPEASSVLRSVGSDSEWTDDLIVWAEINDPEKSPAALLALCRQRGLQRDVRQRMIVAAEQLELGSDDASDCLRALGEHDARAAVELLFTWLARGINLRRSVHEGTLRAMAFDDDPRWFAWVRARLDSGEAFAWEIEALDRWLRRARAR